MKLWSFVVVGLCECKKNSITQFILSDHLLTIVGGGLKVSQYKG